jgi:hypothetical protein
LFKAHSSTKRTCDIKSFSFGGLLGKLKKDTTKPLTRYSLLEAFICVLDKLILQYNVIAMQPQIDTLLQDKLKRTIFWGEVCVTVLKWFAGDCYDPYYLNDNALFSYGVENKIILFNFLYNLYPTDTPYRYQHVHRVYPLKFFSPMFEGSRQTFMTIVSINQYTTKHKSKFLTDFSSLKADVSRTKTFLTSVFQPSSLATASVATNGSLGIGQQISLPILMLLHAEEWGAFADNIYEVGEAVLAGVGALAESIGVFFEGGGGTAVIKTKVKKFILGRLRRIHKIGRREYVTVKGRLVPLKEARRFEK